jgi:ABC-2 type transport system ATP-binding protein
MNYAIETTDLSKSFGATQALGGISLNVAKGSVFGLLGPNGAGKTTTVRLLATLLAPTGGSARVLGHDLLTEAAAIRAKVSLTGQFASVDEDLTGQENLVLLARLLGHSWRDAKCRAAELLKAFDLTEAGGRQARTYSGGMRRKLDIAASLIVTPEILFLDEPTTGLDPNARNQVWDMVRNIAAIGTTVLLTTQYLEEADQLADRLAVIDQGKLIAEGTSRELKASVGSGTLKIHLLDAAQKSAAEILLQAVCTGPVQSTTEGLSVQVANATEAMLVLHGLHDKGIGVMEFSLGSPSLDEVFFALTGKMQPHEETA